MFQFTIIYDDMNSTFYPIISIKLEEHKKPYFLLYLWHTRMALMFHSIKESSFLGVKE